MKVFISSLVAGFEDFRHAAKTAVTTLRHQPVMAEDFGAKPSSPQIACLQGVRESELVVVIFGERYGTVQHNSGLSATHEEYREARGRKPVIAFVQEGATFEREQATFVAEIQGWEGGLFRGSFRDTDELQAGITRALHDYELANAVGPLDTRAVAERAVALVSSRDRNSRASPALYMSVVGGPVQRVLRPAEIEASSLADYLFQTATVGENRFFDRSKGVDTAIEQSTLILAQDRGAMVQLDEQGSLLICVPLEGPATGGRSQMSLPVIVEEAVCQQIGTALGFSAAALDQIDPTQRLTHIVMAARIEGAGYLGWRTAAEHANSPTSVTMGMGFGQERPAVQLACPRAALRLDRTRLIEDLVVPLRRQWKSR